MTLGNDEDYELVTAACYIRLKKYQDAVGILEKILQRSPKNFKALYNLSFCRRAAGSQKDAIADLSKVRTKITYYENMCNKFCFFRVY